MLKKYTYSWLVLAIVFLGIGGGFAFLVAMSRTPFVSQYFPPGYLHHALVGHVILAILLWLLSFAVVFWSMHFNGPELKLSRWLSLAGALIVTLSVLFGAGEAVINNYVPTIDTPVFFLGLALFFVGFSINVFAYLKDALKRLFSPDPMLSALASSVLIAVIMAASMVASLLLNGSSPETPIIYYERLFWIPGHIQQVMNGALLLAVWYALQGRSAEVRGAVHPPTWRSLRYVTIALPISALVLFAIPLVSDPVAIKAKVAAEAIYGIGLGIPVFIHVIHIIMGFRRGFGKGGRSVASVSLVLSMVIYALGMAIAYGGFGNDLRVPAHYHGAVTSLTLGFMALSYYLIKGYRGSVFAERIARVQPLIYGVGMLLFITGLFVSGLLGAPRKTYGVSFTSDPVVLSALTAMGIGTLMAVAGGILFVFYSTVSLMNPPAASDGGVKSP